MTTRKIVIAGANGFIGSYLQRQFRAKKDLCITIGRQNCMVSWTDEAGIIAALEGADMLINLAGKSVNCRYTSHNKKHIFDSRIYTTHILNVCTNKCVSPPKLWINASTATIYRHSEDKPMTELNGEIGTGFSVEVAQKWEATFFEIPTVSTRKVALRMAIVLHATGGALQHYIKITKMGLGGKQGNGKQRFSWIALEDVYAAIEFIAAQNSIQGVVNCAAPESETNETFMRLLTDKLKPFVAFSSPSWLLEIGAFFLETETELLLKSRWVYPAVLIKNGFEFRYKNLHHYISNNLV